MRIVFTSLFLLVFGCVYAQKENPGFAGGAPVPSAASKMSVAKPNRSLAYKVFKSNNTWAFDVIENGRTLLRQTVIPGQSGNTYFKTSEQAKACAQLVVAKLRDGQAPTTNASEAKQIQNQ